MATTRGLEETPYLGSTRLTRPDEEQLASTRHAETTAAPRHRPRIATDPRICIRPKQQFRRLLHAWRPYPRCRQRQHQPRCIPQGEHGGNGESGTAAKVGKPILAPQALELSIKIPCMRPLLSGVRSPSFRRQIERRAPQVIRRHGSLAQGARDPRFRRGSRRRLHRRGRRGRGHFRRPESGPTEALCGIGSRLMR